MLLLASVALVAVPGTAAAYVGPGLGLGAIAAFFGAVFAVLLAIVGVVWYPIKRLFSRRRPATETDQDGGNPP